MAKTRHVIRYAGRKFENDYVFAAEIAALRAHRTGQFQEHVILEWIRSLNLCGTYVDAGAHIGNHTLFFAAFCRAECIKAIEGHPAIFKLLDANVERNLDRSERLRVERYQWAAWRKSGMKVRFVAIPRNNAGHSHVARGAEVGEVEVETTAIDDFEFKTPCTVLKIDVEDTEEEVILGAKATIDTYKPVIVIERHTKQQLADALELLPGYKVVKEWAGVHTFALRCSRS